MVSTNIVFYAFKLSTNKDEPMRKQFENMIDKSGVPKERMGSPELVENDSLSITDVLNTYADENGNVLEDVVTTGLIVMDENNNLLRGSRSFIISYSFKFETCNQK